jgi:hypothetical protein
VCSATLRDFCGRSACKSSIEAHRSVESPLVCPECASQICQMTRPNNILAGSIHVFFEGYFVYNHSRMSSMQDFFGQLWKEYALSDSRYMSSDSLVLCTEGLTVVRTLISPYLTLISPTNIKTAYMGPAVSIDSCTDYKAVTVPPSHSSSGIDRPLLREPHLLFNLLV